MSEANLADRFEDLFLSALVGDGSGSAFSVDQIREEGIDCGEVAVEIRDAEGHGPWIACFTVAFGADGSEAVEFLAPGRGINAPDNPDGFDGLPITDRLRAEAEDEPERGCPSWCEPREYALLAQAREYADRVLSDHFEAMEQVAKDSEPGL